MRGCLRIKEGNSEFGMWTGGHRAASGKGPFGTSGAPETSSQTEDLGVALRAVGSSPGISELHATQGGWISHATERRGD